MSGEALRFLKKHKLAVTIGAAGVVYLVLRPRAAKLQLTPPWASSLPPEYNSVDYWQNMPKFDAKALAVQVSHWIVQQGLNPQPTREEFVRVHYEVAAKTGVPAALIRAVERYETGKDPMPLAINASDSSTAIGIGSTLVGSADDIGLPYVHILWWQTGVYATALELKHKGWQWGQWLPTWAQLDDAHAACCTGSEPAWFKAVRAYHTKDCDKEGICKDTHNRIGLALQGFDAATDQKFTRWNKLEI